MKKITAMLAPVVAVLMTTAAQAQTIEPPDYAVGLGTARDSVFESLTQAWPVAAALFGSLLALRVVMRILKTAAK